MQCKFLKHGITLAYQDVVQPCCVWQFDQEWKDTHRLNQVNLVDWHQQPELVMANNYVHNGEWPKNCTYCKDIEAHGRKDSMRLNAERSYADFQPDDIVLEIRPGSVCNFACQTCWPIASSRVHQYHKAANLLPTESDINSMEILRGADAVKATPIVNFDRLLPVAKRIRQIVLLGGEPFYDKNCLEFFNWWEEHTDARLTVFTNGSVLDIEKIKQFKNPLTLVFSLDATERAAEYIRFGTHWPTVWENYNLAKQIPGIEIRVNITTSVYNFYYVSDLIDLLIPDWPSVVSFGPATENQFKEHVIPHSYREKIILRLQETVTKLRDANIESGQKSNAINAIHSIIANLQVHVFSPENYVVLKDFIYSMDRVKGIRIDNHCPYVVEFLGM
jgi:sulfatase maturation enzyme AslB (radical SAM superfamily)